MRKHFSSLCGLWLVIGLLSPFTLPALANNGSAMNADQDAFQYFTEHKEELYQDAMKLSAELQTRMTEVASEFGNGDIEAGLDEYVKRVIRGKPSDIAKFTVIIPGIGRAEPTTIKGDHPNSPVIIVPKIVHELTQMGMTIVPDEAHLHSVHFRKYESRRLTQSNNGKGRPHVTIALQSQPQGWFTARPKGIYKRALHWFRANDLRFTKDALQVTAFTMALQFITTDLILKFVSGQPGLFNGEGVFPYISIENPALFAFIAGYGIVFGGLNSFWNNVLKAPGTTRYDRNIGIIKRTLVRSIPFSYGYFILSTDDPTQALAALTLLSAHAIPWVNAVINNMIGDVFNLFYDVREEIGIDRGQVSLLGIKAKKSMAVRQFGDLWRFILKSPGIIKDFKIEIDNHALPQSGNILFFLSYPLHLYKVMKYAEEHGYSGAPQIRERWDRTWGKFFASFPEGAQMATVYPSGSMDEALAACAVTGYRSCEVLAGIAKRSLNSFDKFAAEFNKRISTVMGLHCNDMLSADATLRMTRGAR